MISHRLVTTTISAVAAAALLAACSQDTAPASEDIRASDAAAAGTGFAWPASLPVFGDGFPGPGAACRRIGESPATVEFLDDSAALVGCPTAQDAARLGGTVLKQIDGVTLVSVPNDRAATPGDGDGQGDAKVAGTPYNATAQLRCEGYRGMKATMCNAGVQRNAEGGQTLVSIDWPDGVNSRMLIFDQTGKVISANTNEADGSSKFPVVGKRAGDTTIVTIGPERYEVPDVFIKGD